MLKFVKLKNKRTVLTTFYMRTRRSCQKLSGRLYLECLHVRPKLSERLIYFCHWINLCILFNWPNYFCLNVHIFQCCIDIVTAFKSEENTNSGKYMCSEEEKLFISKPQIYSNFYIHRKVLVSPYGYFWTCVNYQSLCAFISIKKK